MHNSVAESGRLWEGKRAVPTPSRATHALIVPHVCITVSL